MLNPEESPPFEKKEPKEIYLQETLIEVKDELSSNFPDLYRDIPTELNYEDKAEELRVNHEFNEDKILNINIKTPEDLSGKAVEDLKTTKAPFLVFEKITQGETISKKIQDAFFLSHEYIHGIDRKLIEENRPDLISMIEDRKKVFNKANREERKEMMQQEENSVFPLLGESFPISLERVAVEKAAQNSSLSQEEKNERKLFWDKHKESLSAEKLESDPNSKYAALDESMTYYKIYQEFGEKGILDFIKNYDFIKLSEIKKYTDSKKRILSEEYKEFLEMDANGIMKKFIKKE